MSATLRIPPDLAVFLSSFSPFGRKSISFIRISRRIWEKQKGEGGRTLELIAKTYDLLASTPWNEVLRGFSDNEPVTIPSSSLSTFHKNQMLELLQQELGLGADNSSGSLANPRLKIENLGFFPKMREAYQLHKEAYATVKMFRFVRVPAMHLLRARGHWDRFC
ncbi:hypothetical protein PENSPDRAFT_672782, partial [Peniophora sp. CONT]